MTSTTEVSAYSSIVANLINRVPLNRIRPKIDPSLRYNQNGFRPGRSTITQVLTLRGILERVKNYHLRSIIVLIDFNKAFVSINHQAMFNIPERIKNAIMLKVATSKGRFYPLTVKQIIFNWDDIFLSCAGWLWHHIHLSLRLIMQSGKPHKKKRSGLNYADDIVLLSDEIRQARQLLRNGNIECNIDQSYVYQRWKCRNRDNWW